VRTYAYPVLSDLPVADVDTPLVLRVLEPMWETKTVTAYRLCGRIEAILDWATACGYRTGENPARWRGHLDKLLPARSKVAPVNHLDALPYAEMPGFMAALRMQTGVAARCLEFTTLTAARSGEAIGAKWSEIDLAARTWTVPAERMKSGKAHVVPLSEQVLTLLAAIPRGSTHVFEYGRASHPLSKGAMTALLGRMGRSDITVHGFRSTFKDWASERTSHADIVSEMALAHAIGDKVEAAYRRGDLLQKRRELMQDWARYCQTEG
jgi:integrase